MYQGKHNAQRSCVKEDVIQESWMGVNCLLSLSKSCFLLCISQTATWKAQNKSEKYHLVHSMMYKLYMRQYKFLFSSILWTNISLKFEIFCWQWRQLQAVIHQSLLAHGSSGKASCSLSSHGRCFATAGCIPKQNFIIK